MKARTRVSGRRALACALAGVIGAAADGAPPSGESFDTFPAGPFTELAAAGGTWRAEPGNAEIHAEHHRSAPHSLRLLGGEDRRVELRWAVPVRDGVLAFQAERWTRREPFRFRVEAYDGSAWREVYDGDRTIRVGGFLTAVEVALTGAVHAVRFTCTSPASSGLLIDDLGVEVMKPMKIVDARCEQRILPVLIRNLYNPLVCVNVRTEGRTDPVAVEELIFTLEGTDNPGDVASVSAFYAGGENPLAFPYSEGEQAHLAALEPYGEPGQEAAPRLVFRGARTLRPGDNHFVLSCVLKEEASLFRHVDASCISVGLAGGKILRPQPEPRGVRQRIGYAVRKCGDDGARAYRIPGLATTKRGTLVGVYDIRYKGWGDLPGVIDLGMSRSTDGGQRWEPMRIILTMGEHDRWNGNGVGDPAVLVDEVTGTIWVAAVWSHGNRGWHGSGPGLTPEETGQLLLTRSDDDGVTWSAPINITAQVKRPEWAFLLQGPGRGITMRDGTLVFAAQYQDPPASGRTPHATILYSRDRGATWHVGTGARADTTEAQVAELADGRLMLNMRDNRGGSRSVYTTGDLGATWQEHPTSRRALPEPVCMAGLYRHTPSGLLLFSNPATTKGRYNMTIKVSGDDGMTWPEARHALVDEGQSAGYSCLSGVGEDAVGILYEGSRAPMTYLVYRLAELVRTAD